MKGNYPNPTLPSALQYLWVFFFFFLFHPLLTLHHLRLFIIFTTWFHLYSLFPSLLAPHNVLLPSSSQPFIPSSLTFSFICPCLDILCPLTCQYTFFLLSTVFYSPLFSHSCCFSFDFFIYTLLSRKPSTELVTKALYEWEHLYTSYFYFEVSGNCVLVIQPACVVESSHWPNWSNNLPGSKELPYLCWVKRNTGNVSCWLSLLSQMSLLYCAQIHSMTFAAWAVALPPSCLCCHSPLCSF